MDDKSPYMTIINIWKFLLLKIGLSPLLHRYPKPAVRFNIIGTGFPNRIILFKSLIANMAGFFMVINNQYYDWGFQSRFSAMAIILSMGMIYSIMEGIVPSRCRITTRHLGATLFKLRLHQICKSHVAASMHHDTWGLMQSHFCSPHWRPDSSHRNEPALGGYQLLLSTIQGTHVFIYYWRIHCSVGKAQSSQPCGRGFKPHDRGYIV